MGEMLPKVLIVFAFCGHRLTVHVLVGQLLLGYLPNDRALWEQELAKKRSQYEAFKEEFLDNTVCHFTTRLDFFYLDCQLIVTHITYGT